MKKEPEVWRAVRTFPAVLAAAVAMAALAGCISPNPPSPSLTEGLLLPMDCASLGPRHCDDAGGRMVVRDLHLVPERDGTAWTGIRVAGLAQSLELRNVTVEGFEVGIRLEPAACLDCEVVLRQVRLVGMGAAGSVGLLDASDHALPQPPLEVRGLDVRGFAIGVSAAPMFQGVPRASVLLQEVVVACDRHGVLATAGHLTVVDVRATGCVQEGLALYSTGSELSRLQGGAAVGNGNGAHLAGDWLVTGFEASGNRVRGVLHAGASITAFGLVLQDNGDAGTPLSCAFCTAGRGILSGSIVAGNRGLGVGTNFPSNAGPVQEPVLDARGNWWGAATGPTPAALPVRPPGSGDTFGEAVLAAPFLDAPPSA